MRRNSYVRFMRRNSYILFLPLVVWPSHIRGYALSHSAEVTHSFIQQAPSLPMMADKDVPHRSDRLTKEEKVNHTKRVRATNKLQASLDHLAPASRKKQPKAARTKKKMDQLARVNFTKDGGIREEVREEPNTDGPLVFWSDSFLRHFIKQEENSVWILNGGGLGGESR
jgi:hypothetical protein